MPGGTPFDYRRPPSTYHCFLNNHSMISHDSGIITIDSSFQVIAGQEVLTASIKNPPSRRAERLEGMKRMPKGKIELIIFDLDGTLVDSSRDITNALNFALDPWGLGPLTVEETVKLVGEGITRLIEKVTGPGRKEIAEDVLRRFMDFYSAHLTDYTVPFPGVVETLEELRGYRKAVVSNKREALSIRLLDEIGLKHHFAHVLGSDSTAEKKPSPQPILTILEREGTSADRAVMVGDSDIDIEAGRRAGVVTVGAAYGYRPVEALEGADFLIREGLPELPHILTSL